MITIYAVFAMTHYEGGSAMCAFTSEADAIACKEACEAHDVQRPPCPEIVNSLENDKEWADYTKVEEAWRARHPVNGDFIFTADYYAVGPLELRAAALKETPHG